MPIDFCKSSPEAHLRPGSLPANSLDWLFKALLQTNSHIGSSVQIISTNFFSLFEMAESSYHLAVPQVWHYTSRYCYCMIY